MSTTFGAWQHKGTVLASSAGHNPQQPNVIYEGNAKILSGTVFKMWYNDWTGSVPQISYAESTNGTTWTTYSSNPVIAGQGWSKVYKSGSTYYMFTTNSGFTSISVYTSTDGLTWTLQKSGAIGLGSAGAWDSVGVAQLNVIDIISGTWYGYYTGNKGGTSAWSMGLATSTDGINWVKGANNPVITYEGPSNFDWHKVGSVYYGWSQVVLPNIPYATQTYKQFYPSDIIRFSGANVAGPFTPLATPVFQRTQSSEGPTVFGGQVADPVIVSDGTNLWMFFTATASGDGEDGQSGPWMINAAEAPNTTLAQLVNTFEGIQTFPEYTLAGLALSQQVIALDNCQRANENPLSDGGKWLAGTSGDTANIQLLNNQMTGITSVTQAAEMYWSGAINNDQWAQCTAAKCLESNGEVGVLLRGSVASFNEYRFYWTGILGSSGTFKIEIWINGAGSGTVTATGTVNVGDVLTAFAIGNNLYFYQNGYLVLSSSDNRIASGKPGPIVYGGSTHATDAALSSWSAGNVVALPANVSTWKPLAFKI